VRLANEVECDEAYVIAGHNGQPEIVKDEKRKGRRRRLKGKGGRGTMKKQRPPVFGMIERGGQVVIHLLDNVKQKTSSHSSKIRLSRAAWFTQMSTAFMLVWRDGATRIKASTMAKANMPETKMAMGFVKCM
jgi:hypothetical protein